MPGDPTPDDRPKPPPSLVAQSWIVAIAIALSPLVLVLSVGTPRVRPGWELSALLTFAFWIIPACVLFAMINHGILSRRSSTAFYLMRGLIVLVCAGAVVALMTAVAYLTSDVTDPTLKDRITSLCAAGAAVVMPIYLWFYVWQMRRWIRSTEVGGVDDVTH